MRHASHIRLGFFGLALGLTVSRLGFTDFGELHRMFVFGDLRLFLAFGGAVVLAGIGFALHCRGRMPERPIHRGTIPGAILFGAGWAVCGACPGAVLAQLGEGKVPALLTVAGIVAGAKLGHRARSALRIDGGSCGS
jgi:uncharacterized membrane protein YedE/YeeE